MQSDRPRSPDDGKRDLPQLRALDPMPVLGDAGVVSSILNCVLKLVSATSTTDICSRSVLRAAEPDPRGHKRAVDAHHLLCERAALRASAACSPARARQVLSCGRCAPPLQRSASFCLVVLRRCCSSALATFAACESPRVSGRHARMVPPSCSTTHGREADSAPSFLLANKSCFWHRRKRGKSLAD
jgi:hypothetical protein